MKNIFNIYYINYEKASEISMLLDNEIVEKIVRIKNTDMGLDGEGEGTLGAGNSLPLIGKYLPSLQLNGNASYSRSNRVEDTVKVVSSKSTILSPVYKKAKEVHSLDNNKVGNLIKIKGVYLRVVNTDDVMAIKTLMSGFLNQITVEGIGDMNITSLIEVMFKGSAYVLLGDLPDRFGSEEHIMLKIPMSAENEMESQYSISDIDIGKVTVLGIYRGKYKRNEIERKINRMMGLNDNNKSKQENPADTVDIEDGVQKKEGKDISNLSNNEVEVHYIDVIAIVQDLHI